MGLGQQVKWFPWRGLGTGAVLGHWHLKDATLRVSVLRTISCLSPTTADCHFPISQDRASMAGQKPCTGMATDSQPEDPLVSH